MPIHDLSYRHWKGQPSGTPPAWVLAVATLRVVLRRRIVRILLGISGLFFVAFGVLLYLEVRLQEGGISNLPDFVRVDARTLEWFLLRQRLVHLLLCLAVGADLVALDRRHKALQIYLSRPLGVGDYVLAKAFPLLLLLSLTSWVPAWLLLVLKTLATADLTWLREAPRLPGAILGYGIGLVVPLTLMTLAVSSLSASPRMAAGQLFALLALTVAVSEVLAALSAQDGWHLLAPTANLDQLAGWVFGHAPRYDVAAPWSIVALAGFTAAAAVVLRRRIRPIDIVGGG